MHYNLYAGLRTDKPKKDGTCPIYLFLNIYRTNVKISTGKSCLPSEWDKAKKNAKRNSPKGIALASYLSKRIADFNAFMLSEEAMGKTVTLELAKSFFEGTNRADFYAFWETQYQDWVLKGEKKYNTLKGYVTTYRILKEIAPKLIFADVNLKLIEKLDHHLTVVHKNCPNSKFTKHKNFRLFINRAVKEKFIKENPYKDFSFAQAIGDRAFLTVEELEKVRNCDVSNGTESLQKAKDLFLFSTYTGLRFGDLMALQHKSVKPTYLEFVMEKTSKPIMIPLMPQAKKLIEKYSKGSIIFNEKNVFPKTANALINRKLKELMQLAGIDKKITCHSARTTFATLLLSAKTNIVHLKALMGHQDIKTTMIYLRNLNED